MTAYRDRYAKIQAKGAQMVAISTDDVETLKRFKDSLGAPFPFLSDPDGKVADLYGGSSEGHAKRNTFVIHADGTIGHTDSGMASLVPDPAIDACPQGAHPTTI